MGEINIKFEKAIDYAKDYVIRVEGLDTSYKRKREAQQWLPLVLLELAGVAENFPEMTNKNLKDSFVSVASTLMEHEEEYDPNPGKTRYSANYIKDYLALG